MRNREEETAKLKDWLNGAVVSVKTTPWRSILLDMPSLTWATTTTRPPRDRPAHVLDPNLAAAWHFSGWVSLFIGEPEPAIETFDACNSVEAIRCPTGCCESGVAFGHFFLDRV